MSGPVTDKPMDLPDIKATYLHSALEQAVDFLALLSLDGMVLSVRSPRTASLLAIEPQALVGLPLNLFLADADAARFTELLRQVGTSSGFTPFNVQMLKTDGGAIWLEGLIGKVNAEPAASTMILLALHDVTKWKLATQQVDEISGRDALTGLANRTLLPAQILKCAESARKDQPLTLMVIDLDGFKQVNDSLGHSIGDKLLAQLAKRLDQIAQTPDVLFRSGGSEFTVLRPPAPRSSEDDTAMAQRIIHAICRPFYIEGQTVRVACHIGIVRCPDEIACDTGNADAFLRNADLAMDDARTRGKNSFSFFNEAMSQARLRQQTIEEALYEGINNGEFELHYQPIVNQDGTLVGMEGLMRWPRPEGEQYSPAEFIPIAESKGLIHLLGNWALRTACYQAARWQEAGWSGFYVTVNVSPQQFTDEGFVETVRQSLQEANLQPGRLVLEITEGLLMDSAAYAEQMLKELNGLGVQVAIDDFGTGYSSLAYLKKFNLSTLKIDKSFIDDLPDDKDNCAIINAVLGMARELGLKVVAEGVETNAQWQWLKTRGCGFMQGYLFCRPLPASRLFEQYGPRTT